MYVCICHAITEREVHAAIVDGANTLDHLRDRLAAGTCCGACAEHLENCLDRHAAGAHSSAAAVPALS